MASDIYRQMDQMATARVIAGVKDTGLFYEDWAFKTVWENQFA